MGSETRTFSWGRALIHGAIAFVLVCGLFLAIGIIAEREPDAAGRVTAKFSLIAMIAAWGASWLYQTGRRWAAAIVACIVLGLPVALLVRVSQSAQVADGEIVRTNGWIRHPAFEFSIPDPGDDLTPVPRAELPQQSCLRLWAFRNEEFGEGLSIGLVAEGPTDEQALEEHLVSALAGHADQLATLSMTADERTRTVAWEERHAHAYVVGEDHHFRIDIFALETGEALLLTTLAPTAERFAGFADAVKLR